jgi:hypothetical protein
MYIVQTVANMVFFGSKSCYVVPYTELSMGDLVPSIKRDIVPSTEASKSHLVPSVEQRKRDVVPSIEPCNSDLVPSMLSPSREMLFHHLNRGGEMLFHPLSRVRVILSHPSIPIKRDVVPSLQYQCEIHFLVILSSDKFNAQNW